MANKDDTQKMLKIIINGQSSFRQEILKKFKQVDEKFENLENGLNNRIDGLEVNLTKRIDKLGKQLAYLEDDTPTGEEFRILEKRVDKLEHQTSPQAA